MERKAIAKILDSHARWLSNGLSGSRACFRGADLSRADLSGANLYRADLRRANLRMADLSGANLGYAFLNWACLKEADISRANLSGADLQEVDLTGAIMPFGETFEQYLAEVVPSLLTAGGKPLSEVATEEHWNCHTWQNCPIAVAFYGATEREAPKLLRHRISEFVMLFDAGLIPMPTVHLNSTNES